MIKCPECGMLVQNDKLSCSNCGYPFDGSEEHIDAIICPECGEVLDKNVTACTCCGYIFSDETKSEDDILLMKRLREAEEKARQAEKKTIEYKNKLEEEKRKREIKERQKEEARRQIEAKAQEQREKAKKEIEIAEEKARQAEKKTIEYQNKLEEEKRKREIEERQREEARKQIEAKAQEQREKAKKEIEIAEQKSVEAEKLAEEAESQYGVLLSEQKEKEEQNGLLQTQTKNIHESQVIGTNEKAQQETQIPDISNYNDVKSRGDTSVTGLDSKTETYSQGKSEEGTKKRFSRKYLFVAAIVIILFIFVLPVLTGPKLKSITATYNGDTQSGVVLDDQNPGFSVTALYTDGSTRALNPGDWSIEEINTLEADQTSKVKISYKDVSAEVLIKCSSTEVKYIKAKYNGSEYEEEIINKDSDFTVTATYGDGSTKDVDKWYVEPKATVLKKGEKARITVYVDFSGGLTLSDEIVIEGKEKPFTNPQIEGDHYNCSSEQFVKYLNSNTKFILVPTEKEYFEGDGYSSYLVNISGTDSFKTTGLALRENGESKLEAMIIISENVEDGVAEAISLAEIFDSSIDRNNNSKLAGLLLYKVYESNNTVIAMDDRASDSGYVFYIMTKRFFERNFKN